MPDRFKDERVDREGRLSIGIDQKTGDHYLSIPVSNAMVDYEEYYRISAEESARYTSTTDEARAFAEECRQREHDDRLILEPGTDRGVPL